ncbi:MAG: hypothetical protein FJ145_16470 [Deltaproteobacteria bacterium]|nr:hypothetical protein [Deltaproteobacteria bacterium]
MKKLLLCLVLALSTFLLPLRASAQTTNLPVAFNGFGGTASIFLGRDVGIFKKQGLSMEMIFIPGGSISVQAWRGKSLEVLLGGGPPVLNTHLQGGKVKIVGGVTNVLPYAFVVALRQLIARHARRWPADAQRHGSGVRHRREGKPQG